MATCRLRALLMAVMTAPACVRADRNPAAAARRGAHAFASSHVFAMPVRHLGRSAAAGAAQGGARIPPPSTPRAGANAARTRTILALRLSAADGPVPSSHVHLVGSGIGGVEHLTVQAKELLQRADAVVYDALADKELLGLTPPGCDHFYVGKRGGDGPGMPVQQGIDALLVQLATSGKHRVIVRLKAGDPFIFGRPRSEVQALSEAQIAWSVVPGLSSAVAGPLMAGVALTDPALSRSFAVMSGVDANGEAPVDLAALGPVDTLVFLMGGSRLGILCQQLRDTRPRTTPVVVVKWAGHPSKQRIWRGTLATIEDVTAGESLSPAVIVVGETAGAPMLASQPTRSDSGPSVVGATATAVSGGPGGGALVDEYDTWLLDLDGVLWGGQGVVEGSVEAVAALMRNGRVFYVTNNSARTRKDVAAKLAGLGFTGVLEDDVITSGWAAAEFLSSQEPPCRKAFVIGSSALVAELQARGITCVTSAGGWGATDGFPSSEAEFASLALEPEVTAVVCGWDAELTWGKLAVASAYLQSGVPLVATNPDVANKVGGRLMPENGAQVAALMAAAGLRDEDVVVVGKPSAELVNTLARKWDLDRARTIMVGDRLDTDVVFGNRAGIATALVLSGVATQADADVAATNSQSDACPTYVLTALSSVISGEGIQRIAKNS